MNIFFRPDIDKDILVLDPVESQHCSRVLRSQSGDRIRLVDGTGGYYEAEIIDNDPKATKIRVVSKQLNYKPLRYAIHMAVAPTKNMDRFEWFVEKATELGISSITPIICTRSERRKVRTDRLEKVMIAAAKQSVRAHFPKINEMLPYDKWIRLKHTGNCYIAHCSEGERVEIGHILKHSAITVAIGPEGDFTEEEVAQATEQGFMSLSLGDIRLRTETAGIYVCAAMALGQK